MHITGMTIVGIPPFTEPVEFKFDERVNVLIGPNATGKSMALRNLQWRLDPLHPPERTIPGYAPQKVSVSASGDWPKNRDGAPDPKAIPAIYLPPLRQGMPSPPNINDNRVHQPIVEDWNDWDILLTSTERDFFQGRRVYHAVQKLWGEDLANPSYLVNALGASARDRAAQVGLAASRCTAQICREVMRDSEQPNIIVERLIRQTPPGMQRQPVVHYAMGVHTTESEENPLYVGELSTGTQGVYLWIWFLAIRMAYHCGFKRDWQTSSAVLCIDEIENHLHPTWQRRVIPALLEHFPGLQIFATTHSPFVVAGLKAGQVHLLSRDANGVVIATTNTEDIVGWTADEILRTMMGVEDPTDDATAAAARELRQLRNDGPRDMEDAEAARQARMQELRRKVDRDLLAGGPAAAQEELFEQQFAEALEKYLQARDSGQENG